MHRVEGQHHALGVGEAPGDMVAHLIVLQLAAVERLGVDEGGSDHPATGGLGDQGGKFGGGSGFAHTTRIAPGKRPEGRFPRSDTAF